jgi:hypothetical protein
MSCDFATYYELRTATLTVSETAQQACDDEATATKALEDAHAALTAAQQDKTDAYAAWQSA